MSILSGHKTQICGIAAMIVSGLEFFNVIDPETTQFLYGILGGGAGLALRSAIGKLELSS